MSTAFQPDGFQGDAFQIGAPAPPVTVDEIVPQIGAAIISTIAISGWVFAGTPNPAPNFQSYEPMRPPMQAPRQQIRPYEDTYYRYANSQQSVIGIDSEARRPVPPRINPRPEIDTYYRYANSQQSAIGIEEPARPTTISTRRGPLSVLLPPDVFIPRAASYPHTGPQPVLVPAGTGQNLAFTDDAFPFVAPSGATYPVGLTEPARPKPQVPRPSLRNDLTGTVGVFFYEISQPFDWGDSTNHPIWKRPSQRRPESDPFMPAVVAPIYDYGWYSEPQRPTQLKPPYARNLTPDTIYPVAGSTADYGWYAPPRLPVQQKPSSGIYLTPDTFIIVAGVTPDYGWYSEPQRPVQLKPPNAIYLIPDYWPWELTPPVDNTPHFGGWPHKKGGHLKKKKRKDIPAFEDRLPTARQTLLQVLADIQERQDEEDILMILRKIYDS